MPIRPLVRLFLTTILAASSLAASFLPAGAQGVMTGHEKIYHANVDINSLTTEEKIGQLFLVTFEGTNFEQDSGWLNLPLLNSKNWMPGSSMPQNMLVKKFQSLNRF